MSTISKPSAVIGNILDQANLRIPGNITVQPDKAKAIRGRAKRHDDDVDGGRQNLHDDVSVVPADGAVDVAEFQDGMMLAQADINSIGEGVAVGVAVASDGSATIAAAEVASQSVTAKMIGGGVAVIGGIAAASGGGGGGGDSVPLAPTPTVTTVGTGQVDAAAAAVAAAAAAVTTANATNAAALAADATAAGTAAAQAAAIAGLTDAEALGAVATITGTIAATTATAAIAAPAVALAAASLANDAAAAAAAAPGNAELQSIAAAAAEAAAAAARAEDLAPIAVIVTAEIAAVALLAAQVAAHDDVVAAGAAEMAAASLAAAQAAAHDDAVALAAVATADAAAHHSPITVTGFDAGPLASGGDIIDMSAIASLTDSVATGLNQHSDFGANNVFIFDGTAVSIDDAASAIAADDSVVATQGYIVIRDSGNANEVTVYHSTDLQGNGAETALVLLSGVNITNLTAANFVV